MIIGIGTDIIETKRVTEACKKEAFLNKYYTEAERKLIQERMSRAASNFAAKEAVSKVFGTGIRQFGLKDIEVLRDSLGKPYVLLHGEARKLANKLQIENIFITLSDTAEYAVAFAVGEGK